MPETPNHGYNAPNAGAEDWHIPLNENFEQHDTDIEIRDSNANLGDYEPVQGAKFLSTDTGVVYTGDGSDWVPTFALGRYTPPPDGSRRETGNVVFGHPANSVSDVSGATVGGGGEADDPNSATGDFSTVAGGQNNSASGSGANVAGGYSGVASGGSSTVAGGNGNEATGRSSIVGGGAQNTASGLQSTVTGGLRNTASARDASVGGGEANEASAPASTVAGGLINRASAEAATVPGGQDNEASGAYAHAAGRGARAEGAGAFVWGDSSGQNVRSTEANEFKVQAGGGAVIFSSSDLSSGVNLQPGSGSWAAWSARASKANVESVDAESVLDRLESLDVATWNYRAQGESVRHMGPMAEAFADAFGLGADDERISNVDADGVALAAIQGLADRLERRDDRIDELEVENEALRDRLGDLEARVESLAGTAEPESTDGGESETGEP